MKILVVTQNETIFLPAAIDLLIRRMPDKTNIVGFIILDASPFGKNLNFLRKLLTTINIFGLYFSIRYGIIHVFKRILNLDVINIVKQFNFSVINIDKNINSKETLNKISELNPDLILSISGNQIFKKSLLNIPQIGILNLHTSLLPKYRGLMPTFWVLQKGEKKTGVSVFFVDEGIDTGPIIVQKEVKISKISQFELIKLTKLIGIEAMIQAIEMIMSGNYMTSSNKNEEGSYFSFPTRKEVVEFKKKGCRFF